LIDADSDGVLDLVVGTSTGIRFFKGDAVASSQGGTPPLSATTFSEVVGSSSPFDGVGVGVDAMPTAFLVDGALHFLVGNRLGDLTHLVPQSDGGAVRYTAEPAGPFSTVTVNGASAPFSADLNNDSLPDLILGQANGQLAFFPNIGSASAPGFAAPAAGLSLCEQGASAPCLLGSAAAALDAGDASAPAFADWDGDGDLDLWVGAADGVVYFYENIGTPSTPMFVRHDDSGTFPFAGLSLSGYAHPFVADLDADGDLDMLAGASDGRLHQFLSGDSDSAELLSGEALPYRLGPRVGVRLQLPLAMDAEAVPYGSAERAAFEAIFTQALRLALRLSEQGLDASVVQSAAGSLIVTFDLFVVDARLGGVPLESAEELACELEQPGGGALAQTDLDGLLVSGAALMRVLALSGERVPVACPPPPPYYLYALLAICGLLACCFLCVLLCCADLVSRGLLGRWLQLTCTHSSPTVPFLYLPREQREAIRQQRRQPHKYRGGRAEAIALNNITIHPVAAPVVRGWHGGAHPRGQHCWDNSAGAAKLVVALQGGIELAAGTEALVLALAVHGTDLSSAAEGATVVEPGRRTGATRSRARVEERTSWYAYASARSEDGARISEAQPRRDEGPPEPTPIAPSWNLPWGSRGVLQLRRDTARTPAPTVRQASPDRGSVPDATRAALGKPPERGSTSSSQRARALHT